MNKINLSITILLLFAFTITSTLCAQNNEPRASQKAEVSQIIGIDTEVTFSFSRPGVKGRVIWGELVPWGLEKGNNYSNNKDFPWRGGANASTTIELSKDLLIEGNKVPAGKYSMHFIPGKEEWSVMINKADTLWGSYQYDVSQDVATFKVKAVEAPAQEWLIYGFENLDGYKATAYLHWEKLKVPFDIEVAK